MRRRQYFMPLLPRAYKPSEIDFTSLLHKIGKMSSFSIKSPIH
jgi:hypothetical protein